MDDRLPAYRGNRTGRDVKIGQQAVGADTNEAGLQVREVLLGPARPNRGQAEKNNP